MKKVTRRNFIKNSMFFMLGFLYNLEAKENDLIINKLRNVLIAINKPVCNYAAKKLSQINNNSSYNLHLRNANLSSFEIQRIAKAIQEVNEQGGPRLKSFSMSYNNLGDTELDYLFEALPNNLIELGLVKCGIKDSGGKKLLEWANNTSSLDMICVEDNFFSNAIKLELKELQLNNKWLSIIV